MSGCRKFDITVIGGGPGSYVAAIKAAQVGMKVALVEREHLGGICSNWGCIPTKTLLHTADIYREIKRASELGITTSDVKFDFAKIVMRSRKAAEKMNDGVRLLLKKKKITVIEGHGRLAGDGRIDITESDGSIKSIHSESIILATGARPKDLPNLAADGVRIWNYRHALAAEAVPTTLLIVGAGAIGVEFASFYATFGAKVTLVEAQGHVVPTEDHEVSALLQTEFGKQGIDVHTSTRIVDAAVKND